MPNPRRVWDAITSAMDAAAAARARPDGIVSGAGGVSVRKVGDRLVAEMDGKPVGEMNLSWRGPYATSVTVRPEAQRRGIASQMYQAAEDTIGRPLVPSPLGLSDSAIALWKSRLGGMEPEQAQKLLRESAAIGQEAGVGKSSTSLLQKLGLRDEMGSLSVPPAQKSLDDLIEEARQQIASRETLADSLLKAGGPVRMGKDGGRSALVGPDMSNNGMFRITRFDEQGPVGHTEYRDMREAIIDALREGYGVK